MGIQPAGSPRKISTSADGKAQEPTFAEWQAAAKYNITLKWPTSGTAGLEATLAVDYEGDAARIYYKGRLLTDNWFSGYNGDGAMQVGITHLADENPGILEDGAQLQLWVLPLSRTSLESKVFLLREF